MPPAATLNELKDLKLDQKVLVQSRYREPRVKTWEQFSQDPKTGAIVTHAFFRQFHEFKCWMTKEEASFLVNSDENQKHEDEGYIPPYFFPLGQAVIVDADFRGKTLKDGTSQYEAGLAPPNHEDSLQSSDGRQAAAARAKAERGRKALEKAGVKTAEHPAATIAAGPTDLPPVNTKASLEGKPKGGGKGKSADAQTAATQE